MSGIKFSGLTAMALVLGLGACGTGDKAATAVASETPPASEVVATETASGAAGATAVANLRDAQGKAIGTATAMPGADTLTLSLRAEGLPPGDHGVHVHMVGKCEGPKFESAGAHLNPGNKQHGLENAQGQHVGDMPNLTVGADGRGTLTYALKGGSIDALLDGDGSAIVVHAKADDQKTDPSGDSGDRIACGVFSPG